MQGWQHRWVIVKMMGLYRGTVLIVLYSPVRIRRVLTPFIPYGIKGIGKVRLILTGLVENDQNSTTVKTIILTITNDAATPA